MTQHDDHEHTVELGAKEPTPTSADDSDRGRSIESEILLARARKRLLADKTKSETPMAVGRYRIIECLGRGGMGIVYSARDDELDRNVAIKVLHSKWNRSEEGRARLVREAQAMAKLSHPNVGHVYEVGEHGDQMFLAMELVEGQTLRQWVTSRQRTWREITRIHAAAGEGLAAAHAAGLVHRDYKLDNVLVGTDGRPRVVDFGLARPDSDLSSLTDASNPDAEAPSISGSGELTKTGSVVGTPAYMAPEQHAGGLVDARADQFAFCVALFECLYGRRPFTGSTVTQLARSTGSHAPVKVDRRRRGVPGRLHAAVLRGLRPDPAQRFPSMHELIAEMRAVLEPRAWWRKVAPVAAATLTIGAAVGVFALRGSDEPVADTASVADEDPWAAIVAASDLPPVVDEPIDDDPSRVTVHRLRNGLTVYVAPRPGEPSIHLRAVVRASPAHEPEDAPGISKLTLSSLMAGSERLGTRDFVAESPHLQHQHQLIRRYGEAKTDAERKGLLEEIDAAEHDPPFVNQLEPIQVWQKLGVRDFGTVSGPLTTIFAGSPRNRFRGALTVLADMLRNPTFRQFGGAAARKIEIARRFASGDLSSEVVARELAPAVGYAEDPAAGAAFARTLPLDEVKDFHHTFYRPNNMALVLVGDISPDEALPLVEELFGDWEPALLPKHEMVYRPLESRRAVEIEDGGLAMVELVWPLPPASMDEGMAYDQLLDAMVGPDGLLASAFAAAGREDTPGVAFFPRRFTIGMWPLPGETLDDVERVAIEAMQAIADDKLPDDAWDRALARQELEANLWARESDGLADLIAGSFNEGRPWADVARDLTHPRATREELRAAVKTLTNHGYLAVRQKQGKAYRLPVEPLPIRSPAPNAVTEHSEFAQSLLDARVTPLEPLFVVKGRHFERKEHGNGTAITTHEKGPLFFSHFVYPVGVRSDPWVCDALRAKLLMLRKFDDLRGVSVHTSCLGTETILTIIGVARRFDELWPAIVRFASLDDLPPEVIAEHVERTLDSRRQIRGDPDARSEALHTWALLGGHSVHGRMPDDRTMRARGPVEIARALTTFGTLDPDVLYAGPDDKAVMAALPSPRGGDPVPLEAPGFREVDAPTIFLVEDPHREDIDVRVATIAPSAAENGALLQRVWEEELRFTGDASEQHPGEYNPGDIAEARTHGKRFFVMGFNGPPDELLTAIDRGLQRVRKQPTRPGFDRARDTVENRFRANRTRNSAIPQYVRTWKTQGTTTDPRLIGWLSLSGITFDEYKTYAGDAASASPIISVIAHPKTVDRAALAERGKVVVVRIEDVLRDVEFQDSYVFWNL